MFTVEQAAKFINGKVIGDGKTAVTGISGPDLAVEGDITFASDSQSLGKALNSKASCVVTHETAQGGKKSIIQVENLKLAMTMLYNAMVEMKLPKKGGIHPGAIVSGSAVLGANVFVGPGAVIDENVKLGSNSAVGANSVINGPCCIGENVIIYPNVTIYKGTKIGNNVIIHSGTVIGSDGFGFLPKDGKVYKVPQLANVVVEDDVEIGSNVCIDRGTFTDTVIGKGTKLDNLIQIAHNCKLGRNVLIAGQSGIAGSTVVGDNTMMGGGVGVADHVTIGKNVKIGPKSSVKRDIEDDQTVMGYPAIDGKAFLRLFALQNLFLKKERKLRGLLRGE